MNKRQLEGLLKSTLEFKKKGLISEEIINADINMIKEQLKVI